MSFFGSDRGMGIPPVTKNIIIINVLIFAAYALPIGFEDFMTNHMALHSLKSPLFEPHQIITHIFMHANIGHIFFNMFAVFMFGRVVEQILGSKKMLIFYTVTGLGAAALHLTVNYFQMQHLESLTSAFYAAPDHNTFSAIIHKYLPGRAADSLKEFIDQWMYNPDNPEYINQAKSYVSEIAGFTINAPMVGASGAVFGLLIAFAMMFPDAELMLIFFPVPVKAKYFVPVYALLELFFGVAGFSWDNIAHFAHLGGALFGFLLIKWWKRNQFRIY